MSELRVDKIVSSSGSGSVEFTQGINLPEGVVLSGIAQTAQSLTPNSNVNTSGIITASSFVSAGTITAVDFNSTSDLNLKENVQVIENAIDKLVEISGVTFDWKETKQVSAGVIAQDVEKVFPEVVKINEYKTVNYNGLIGLLVESIKEQQKQIEELKKKVDG